ncbi:hypothetical protein P1X14_10340 [Sphingomonas sp. AOB5]|uniref:hypothetical protein n=1 Tax=Sphingomonas sp. AOB5 TaxID=3034017 RepID=UPI0023F9269A|nr:hypothetical protein [Sphingomonas sp. AOB5]MDF7775646.1 hypothetical protein [Sphingomonas sp. AOB5]
MRYLLLAAAAAVVLPLTHALADWAPSKWGMTPEQVIKVVPNAVAMPMKENQILRGRHMLAEAPTSIGNYPVTARYYFSPTSRTLELVNLTMTDRPRCAAFRDMLVARYGAGERRDVDEVTPSGVPYVSTTIEWTNVGGDRGTYSDAHSPTVFGLCKLIVQKR